MRSNFAAVLLVVFLIGLASLPVHAQIPATFFGMHMTGGMVNGEPWPADSVCTFPTDGCDGFGGISLWDSAVPWTVLNPAAGVYNWRFLDIWMNHAAANNVDILYSFGDTPQWASSNPNDLDCADTPPYPPGTCDPPNDLRPDGSGTDQHWKSFVMAIATHARGRIHYWELWDEASNDGKVNGKRVVGQGRWEGSIPQLLRMAKDARAIILSIDPTAVILTPSSGIEQQSNLNWWVRYLSKGGGKYASGIDIHGYVMGYSGGYGTGTGPPVPENLIPMLDGSAGFRSIIAKYGLNTLPLFDTESGWGVTSQSGLSDPDEQAGFVARSFLVHWSENVARFYWYEWDNTQAGTLWDPNTQTLTKAGTAYQQIQRWMAGNTLTSACSGPPPPTMGVWTCNLQGANGWQAQAVWDMSQSCSNGVCTSSNYTFNPIFTQYVTVYGQVNPTTGSTVPVGYQPILLENGNEP